MVTKVRLKKFYIRTFGCQMNEHDSQKMGLLLKKRGYSRTEDPFEASLIIFNTCTVREKAHHKAISEAGRSRIYKNKNPGVIIAFTGCVAQQEGINLIERYPHIDLVIGPDELFRLPELLDKLQKEKGGIERNSRVAVKLINDPHEYRFINAVPNGTNGGSPVAYVTIMKGCNNACSFCIVPHVRGREVSRPADDIIKEIRALVANGVKEVILLGQNVNSYRCSGAMVQCCDGAVVPDQNQRTNAPANQLTDFVTLVRRIADETDIRRIRFTSPHPKDLSDLLFEEYARNEKLCPHIHLPVQSGSNRILKLMNRGYTREEFMEKVYKLRKARPGISITTDMIVGFPTEDDSDFEETLDLMREVEFDGMYAFKYSPRPATVASKRYEDDVPKCVKEARLKAVLWLNEQITMRKYRSYIGTVQEVLVEGQSRRGGGQLTGRIPTNNIVNFTGDFRQIGSILQVRIKRAGRNSLEGELI